jgi:hypothetical protein
LSDGIDFVDFMGRLELIGIDSGLQETPELTPNSYKMNQQKKKSIVVKSHNLDGQFMSLNPGPS